MTDLQPNQPPLRNRAMLAISRLFFQIAFPLLGGLRVSGEGNVPSHGAVLLCPNHISDIDPAAILAGTTRNDLNALGKRELFDIPVLGAFFRSVGAIPITRDSADRDALRVAESLLKAKRMLLMFPEGRSSQSGKLQKVQPGAALLSLRTKTPIVPIGIRGSRNVLPYGDLLPKFAGGGTSIVFGKPIHPSHYLHLPRRAAIEALTADLRCELARLTRQL